MRSTVFGSLLLLIAVPCAAQIRMDRVVVGSGGGTISNGALRMDLTISQPAIGSTQAGTLEGDLGFWWQIMNTPVAVNPGQPLPTQFGLPPNAPNPFSSTTTIGYAIPEGQHVPVFIGVFNVQGRLVKTLVNRPHDPGRYEAVWDGRSDDGSSLAAGLYFLKISAGPFQRTRKTILLK